MAGRDVSDVFFLNPKNREFAEGKAPLVVRDTSGIALVVGVIAKVVLVVGIVVTLVFGGRYVSGAWTKKNLKGSVRSVTGSVTGCAGPGVYEGIRFHYRANGVEYEQSPYLRGGLFTGGSGMIDACAKGSVEILYVESDPNRWSIAPLSPFKWQDATVFDPDGSTVAGPMLILVAGIFGLASWALTKNRLRRERLRDHGVILEGVLTNAEEETNDESPFNIRCAYQFHDPQGQLISGKAGAYHKGMNKTNMPPPGTRLLVAYVDSKLHQAL